MFVSNVKDWNSNLRFWLLLEFDIIFKVLSLLFTWCVRQTKRKNKKSVWAVGKEEKGGVFRDHCCSSIFLLSSRAPSCFSPTRWNLTLAVSIKEIAAVWNQPCALCWGAPARNPAEFWGGSASPSSSCHALISLPRLCWSSEAAEPFLPTDLH